MDQTAHYFNYIMPKANFLKYSFPYFTFKESETLYVMVPTLNPVMFNQVHENFGKMENCSAKEEILPDFRCKICSATIFNYSDFKIHLQDHQKTAEETSKMSYSSENGRIQGWKNENSTSKSDSLYNMENGAIIDNPDCGSNLNTLKKSAKFSNKNITLSNSSLEENKRQLFSNKLFFASDNSTTPLNNFKVPICSKSGEALEIKNQKLDAELKRKDVVKFPLMKSLDKSGSYMLSTKLSKDTDVLLSSANGNFVKSVSDDGIMKPPLSNELYSSKELLITCNEKINVPICNHDSDFTNFQSQLAKLSNMGNTELEDLNLDATLEQSSEKGIDQTISKFSDYVLKSQVLGDSNISSYSKNKMSAESNNIEKTIGCAKNITSSWPLNSTDVSEHGISTLKPTINAEEKSVRCLHCGKMFESHILMTKHLIHFQEAKNIFCVLCKLSFSSISSLRKHLLMSHCDAKDRRQCPHCDYKCFQTSDLRKHIARRHTRDFKYKCLHCIRGFVTPKELRNHFERKHL